MTRIVSKGKRWLLLPAAGSLLLPFVTTLCHAFGRTFDPVAFTREAQVIFVGKVVELRDASIIVEPKRVLKGSLDSARLEFPWNRQPAWEYAPPDYKAGQELLLFSNKRNGRYDTIAGPEGTQDISGAKGVEHIGVVEKVVAFNAAGEQEGRAKILQEMLVGGKKAQQLAALHIVSDRSSMVSVSTQALVEPVLQLLKSDDIQLAANAVPAISRVGGKEHVPAVISLLASPDRNLAETAYVTLKNWTGKDIPVDSRKAPEQRKAATEQWRKWWDGNKHKVKLRGR